MSQSTIQGCVGLNFEIFVYTC